MTSSQTGTRKITPKNPRRSTESKPCISEQAPFRAVPCCWFYDILTSLPSPRGLYWGSCKSLGKHSHLLREKATWGPSVLYKGLSCLSLHVTIYRAAHLPQRPGHWRKPWLDFQYLSRENFFFFLLLKESKGSPTGADQCPSPGWTTSPSFMASILNWTSSSPGAALAPHHPAKGLPHSRPSTNTEEVNLLSDSNPKTK